MKSFVALLFIICLSASGIAFAADTTDVVSPASVATTDTPPAPPVTTGWGPSVVGSVGAFYFNGNYSLLAAGVNVGAAYTWDHVSHINSVGVYLGPSSQLVNGVTTTTVNALVYTNLFKTPAGGSLGLGLGTRLWQSGIDMGRALCGNTTFFALGYQF